MWLGFYIKDCLIPSWRPISCTLSFERNHIPADDQHGAFLKTITDICNGKHWNGEGGNGSLKLSLPSWLHCHMASAKASALPSGVFLAPFLLTLPDSVKCSMRRLPMRSSAAADEAHQAMTTTWESHWNAESPQTCDYMIPGKRIPNSCKCVVSTPGHVLHNWKSHMCFLRLCLFSFHPFPHLRETTETVEAGFNHSELSVRSWASQLSISHLHFIHPYDFIKTIHHCSLSQDRWDPQSNFSE